MIFTHSFYVRLIQLGISLVVVLCGLGLRGQEVLNTAQSLDSEELLDKARAIRFKNSDQATILFEKAYRGFLAKGDTLQAITSLLEMPYHHGQKVDYAKTYDALWLALFLADDLQGEAPKALIYNKLGRLYSFYKKEDKAFEYLNTSLNINKDLVAKGELDRSHLAQNYYFYCATYRELGQPEIGKIYLDSCNQYYDASKNELSKTYLKFERAFILTREFEHEKAINLFKEIEPWFLKNRPSYLVLVYTYWGDVYQQLDNLLESETYYKKALAIADKYKSHLDFSVLIHERLVNQYIEEGAFNKAFNSQKLARELDAQFFDSRSPVNKPLLEIKDEFRLEKERQERLIQKQRLARLEQEDEISLLQRIILLGALVFTLIIAAVYVMQIRAKHKIEKELIRRNKELEIQKARELLELKNKELATSALQLVEKDEFLKDIKSKLKGDNGNIKTTEIHKVLKSISTSNQSNWEEFKLRFTAVNEDFYKKVTTKYPNLSQSDQKICALIKLNFSSKEMARLLGISVESVHTTRYRLRKKMKLDRSVNLEDFIASL